MKVLSLTEPFATLIKSNKKRIETRSWKTAYRGEIYIHASLTKISKDSLNNKELMSLVKEDLNYGKIICKCKLVDCIYMTKDFINKLKEDNYQEYICGYYEEGRYAWILEDIEPLSKVVEAKGQLGIWDYLNLKEIQDVLKKLNMVISIVIKINI